MSIPSTPPSTSSAPPPATAQLNVNVPKSLLRDIKILILDPRFGRPRYGALQRVVVTALTEWLERQRHSSSN